MSKVISIFRSLKDEHLEQIKPDINYNFTYNDGNKAYILMSKQEGHLISLDSEDGNWNILDYGLQFNVNVILPNVSSLYVGENAIAEQDSELGLCIIWNSKESKRRGVSTLKGIKSNQENQQFDFKLNFEKNTFRGSLDIRVGIILKTAGSKQSYAYINNNVGTFLGELDHKNIRLDGTGSIFPIIEINDKSKPLWTIRMDFEEPAVESFIDKVRIELNRAHRDYKFIDVNSKEHYCDRVIMEIMNHSIFRFLLELYTRDSLLNIGEMEYESGSIMQVAQYLINTFNIDVSTVDSLFISLKSFFEKQGGAYES